MPAALNHYSNVIITHFKETALISYYAMTLIVTLFAMYTVTVIASWFFLRRVRAARNMIIAYYLSGLVLSLILTVVPKVLYSVALQYLDIGILAGSIIGTIIWVPYFVFSSRVKQVFVRD